MSLPLKPKSMKRIKEYLTFEVVLLIIYTVSLTSLCILVLDFY